MTSLSNSDQELLKTIDDCIAREQRSVDVSHLLKLSFGRVFYNHMKTASPILDLAGTNSILEFQENLSFIADWLEAAEANDEAWLRNVDNNGRPNKLMNISTLDQLVAAAEEGWQQTMDQMAASGIQESDERIVEELEGGYYIVQLMSEAALTLENKRLRHGVGAVTDLSLPETAFLSLRDQFNTPHATIYTIKSRNYSFSSTEGDRVSYFADEALDDGFCTQIQVLVGKLHQIPSDKVLQILIPFFKKKKMFTFQNELLFRLEHVVDRHLNWHHYSEMPSVMDATKFCLRYSATGKAVPFKIPRHFINTREIVLNRLKLDYFPDANHHGILKNIRLSSCYVAKFAPGSLSGEKLSIMMTHLTAGVMPEIIECQDVLINFKNIGIYPKIIKAKEDAALSFTLEEAPPMHIEASYVNLAFNGQNDEEVHKDRFHTIKAKTLIAVLDKFGRFPANAETDHLQISHALIPEDNNSIAIKMRQQTVLNSFKVSKSIRLDSPAVLERIKFPDWFSDDILIGFRTREENEILVTLGDFRRGARPVFPDDSEL